MAEWGEIGFSNPIITSATVLGDIISLNWDGGTPGPTVAGPDTGATQGYYLNAQDGVAQLQSALYTPNHVVIDPANNNAVLGTLEGTPLGLILESLGAMSLRSLANIFSLIANAGLTAVVSNGGITLTAGAASNGFISLVVTNVVGTSRAPVELTASARIRRRTANQATQTGIALVMTYTGTVAAVGDITESGAGVYTLPYEGYLVASADVEWAANTANTRILRLRHNGNVIASQQTPAAPTGPTIQNLGKTWYVQAGDTMDVQVLQNSGGNLNVASAAFGVTYLPTGT